MAFTVQTSFHLYETAEMTQMAATWHVSKKQPFQKVNKGVHQKIMLRSVPNATSDGLDLMLARQYLCRHCLPWQLCVWLLLENNEGPSELKLQRGQFFPKALAAKIFQAEVSRLTPCLLRVTRQESATKPHLEIL